MKYYYDLYMSPSLIKKKKTIIRKLNHNQFQINRFVIVLSDKAEEYLEIYNSTILTQKLFEDKELFVVGITDSQEDALRFIADVTQKVYEETKDADLKSYFVVRQQKFEKENEQEKK